MTPLHNLRRAKVALETGVWPDDLRDWLLHGLDAKLAGESLEHALGIVPPWGKPSYQRQEMLAARDEAIRALAADLGDDLHRLREALPGAGLPVFGERHLKRILNGGR